MIAEPARRRTSAALVPTHVTKRYGGTLAEDDVSFQLRSGSRHAPVGDNSARKTMLVRLAFGMESPTTGRITLTDDPPTLIQPTVQPIATGIGMGHQHFTVIGAMSVADNVALDGQGFYSRAAAPQRVRDVGERTALASDPTVRVDHLAVSAQQRLESVEALARDARVLILDEPTAALTPKGSEELLTGRRTYAHAGNSVVLITHKLEEALSVADDVTALRRGRVVSAAAADVTIASLAIATIGESLDDGGRNRRARSGGAVVASARNITVLNSRGRPAIRRASFEVRAREIVGITAVEGAGQRELRVLARRIDIASGDLALPQSIGFVPADRHLDALVLEYDAVENRARTGAGARRGRMPWRRIREHAPALLRAFDVRGAHGRLSGPSVSGGNQQKRVLAREMDDHPSLLVVENPPRGLDIRATHDVRQRILAAADGGMAVVLYSSDIDEVRMVATRLLVVHAGAVRDASLAKSAVGSAMLVI